MFPMPSVPIAFADGDRYEWPDTGDVWVRSAADWIPAPDDRSGFLSDAEVRASLHRAVVQWDVKPRFVPVVPGEILPGMRLHSLLDLLHLDIGGARSVAQYVRSDAGGKLVPLRESVAEHAEDFAYDVPGTVTYSDAVHVLDVILAEQLEAEVSYDAAAGRLYARYVRHVAGWETTMLPQTVECLHVFMLSASPAEA